MKKTTELTKQAPATPDVARIGRAVLQLLSAVAEWSKTGDLQQVDTLSAVPLLNHIAQSAVERDPAAQVPSAGIDPAKYYATTDVAAALGLKEKTLACWRGQGAGPAFRKHGRRVFYLGADVTAWSDRRRLQSTSQKIQGGTA